MGNTSEAIPGSFSGGESREGLASGVGTFRGMMGAATDNLVSPPGPKTQDVFEGQNSISGSVENQLDAFIPKYGDDPNNAPAYEEMTTEEKLSSEKMHREVLEGEASGNSETQDDAAKARKDMVDRGYWDENVADKVGDGSSDQSGGDGTDDGDTSPGPGGETGGGSGGDGGGSGGDGDGSDGDGDDSDGDGDDSDGDGDQSIWDKINEWITPLVIDLDGDGVELSSLEGSEVYFDLSVDGYAERTGWVSADDALLALDVNGNGWIDDNSELFGDGSGYSDGFAALSALDSNSDGIIDQQDDQFSELIVWQDFDQDGISDAGELQSLNAVGITSIDLNADLVDETNQGNIISHRSTVTFDDGSTNVIEDVHFQVDLEDTLYILPEDFSMDEVAALMPVLWGYGQISPSWAALSMDEALRSMAEDLLADLEAGDVDSFLSAFDDFLFAWAGVDDTAPDSRGDYVDARELEFLEKVFGSPYVGGLGQTNPLEDAGAAINDLFDEFAMQLAGRFMAQAPISSALMNPSEGDNFENDVASHPLSGLVQLIGEHTQDAPSLEGDLSAVIIWLEDAMNQGSIDAYNAALTLSVLQPDLSSSQVEYADMLHQAAMDAGIDVDSELYIQIKLVAGFSTIHGTEGSDNLSSTDSTYILAHAGDDTISGGNSGNYILGGSGNDTIDGGDGADTYLYRLGDGNDIIEDHSFSADQDRLLLVDVAISDVVFSITTGGDLVVTFSNGDTITVEKHFDGTTVTGAPSNTTYDMELIEFADGTTLDAHGILDKALADSAAAQSSDGDDQITGTSFDDALDGGAGDDEIDGLKGDDLITGGLGDDVLDGGDGEDTYVYSLGDGNDVINDRSFAAEDDRLVLTDLNVGDVSFSQNSGKDLVIAFSNGETLTITDHFDNTAEDMELIEFADGTTLDAQAIRDKSVADQKAAGASIVQGSQYAEAYYHSMGDGSYTIKDLAYQNVDDKLVLTDVNAEEVVFSINSGSDLLITFSNGEVVTIHDHFDGTHINGAASSASEDMELIEFADGTVLDTQEILDKLLADTVSSQVSSGDDVVVGTHFADVLNAGDGNDDIDTGKGGDVITGGTGDDRLDGGAGADTYIYSIGDGNDVIDDRSFANEDDRLVFTDVNANDVSFAQNSGEDLTITLSDGATITITDHFDGNAEDVELIEFADGTVLDAQAIRDKSVSDQKSGGTVLGSEHQDTYLHSLGDGSYSVTDHSYNSSVDTLIFEDVASTDVTVQRLDSDPDDVVISLSNGEYILLENQLESSYGVEFFEFSDGVTWSSSDLAIAPIVDDNLVV